MISTIITIVVSIPKFTSSLAYSPDYNFPSQEPNLSDVINLLISSYKDMFDSFAKNVFSIDMLYYIPFLVLMSIMLWQIQNATNRLAKLNQQR